MNPQLIPFQFLSFIREPDANKVTHDITMSLSGNWVFNRYQIDLY